MGRAGYREILEMPTGLPKERQWRVFSPRLHVLLTQASVCLLSSLRTKRVSVYVFAISSDKRDCVVLGDCPKSVPCFDGSDRKSVRKMCSCHIVSCHQGALANLLRSSSRQKTCTSFLAHCCFLRIETATDLHFKR